MLLIFLQFLTCSLYTLHHINFQLFSCLIETQSSPLIILFVFPQMLSLPIQCPILSPSTHPLKSSLHIFFFSRYIKTFSAAISGLTLETLLPSQFLFQIIKFNLSFYTISVSSTLSLFVLPSLTPSKHHEFEANIERFELASPSIWFDFVLIFCYWMHCLFMFKN